MALLTRAAAFALLFGGTLGFRDAFVFEKLSADGSERTTALRDDEDTTTQTPERKRANSVDWPVRDRANSEYSTRGRRNSLPTRVQGSTSRTTANLPPVVLPDVRPGGRRGDVGPLPGERSEGSRRKFLDVQRMQDSKLTIRAATFNAGNTVFRKKAKWKEFLKQVSKDHESADIVALGFQEFNDPEDFKFAEMARQSLWSRPAYGSQRSWPSGDGAREGAGSRLSWPSAKSVIKAQSSVRMESATFDSGVKCHIIPHEPHYDTNLYVFVNPRSKWTITQVDYSNATHPDSSKCVPSNSGSGRSKGCNINNQGPQECGKVVNMLVFSASLGIETTKRFCIMNTHMSFKGTASMRMQHIANALDEAKNAGCDSVVFVGDFNSRPHCKQSQDQFKDSAVSQSIVGNSMIHLLSLFYNDSTPFDPNPRRSLEQHFPLSTDEQRDELVQLSTKAKVECYENDGERLSLVTFDNILLGRGLREGKVTFNPTYKLARNNQSKLSKAAYYYCVKGMSKCYVNNDGEDKHNPAWTDRVLVLGGRVDILAYESLDIPERIRSDHLPVVATMQIKPVGPGGFSPEFATGSEGEQEDTVK